MRNVSSLSLPQWISEFDRLKKVNGALRILAAARGLREGLGGSIAVNTARTLIATYNGGRRNQHNKLAEWNAKAPHAKSE